MRMRMILAIAIFLLPMACVMPQSRKIEADKAARSAYEQCEALRKAGSLDNHVAAVDCALPKVINAYKEAAYPFEDLVFVTIAARRMGAANIDNGNATEAEVRHDIAQLDIRIAAEERRRLDVISYGGRPTPTPDEVLLQGLNALTPAPTAAALPRIPANKNPGCFSFVADKRCE